MAHTSATNKAILDIQDCVAKLKICFSTGNTLINDDNPALHRLEEKLEFILLVGLKEKPAVFGGKRSYWDYISTCLSSSKRLHLGLKFVKSSSELKSSLGRGRAFIRFCLMQNCLADTLQSCFIDKKTTRDFYLDHCVPLQPKLWSSLIAYLYDLNEVNFDLNPQQAELDVSWPSFARKLFVSSENQILFGRNLSSNVTPFSMVNGGDLKISSEDKDNAGTEKSQCLVNENSELEANVLYLQKKCETLEKEILYDENEQKIVESTSESIDGFPQQGIRDFKTRNDKYCCEENSLNCTIHCSNCMEKEFNFILNQETQWDCKLSTELHDSKSCDLLHNVLGCSDDFDVPKLSNSNDLLNFTNSEKIKPELVSVTPKSDISFKIDFPDFIKNSCIDMLQSNTKTNEAETSHLKLSDSTYKLIFEMKGLIDNLCNSMCTYSKDSEMLSNFTCLKTVLEHLEINYFAECEKLKECETRKQHFEDFSDYLKSLACKQDALIDSLSERVNLSLKENENLYEKMSFLKDKLHSYGLLKIQTESNSKVQSVSLPAIEKSFNIGSNSGDDINWDVGLSDSISKDSLDSLRIFKKSLSKLSTLNTQVTTLQWWLNSSYKLNDDLVTRVQDHEIHMKGITKELEEAHHLLSVMRKQHQKLQSAENIIKYDLQEKRKLLTRLKHQLETTREDCNLVRMKNSKSEVEWKKLRKEFALRNKQTSEESGFIDDKGLEEHSVIINNTYDPTVTKPALSNEDCSNFNDVESKYILKKNRLQMLEEQCKLLCSNLVNSSKKREEIDCRLESWCKAIEKSHEASEPEKLTTALNMHHECISRTDEMVSENIVDSCSDLGTSLVSSEIGSVNSDCVCIPHNSTLPSTDICFSLEPLKIDYSIPSKITNLECCQSEILLEDLGTDSNTNSKNIYDAIHHESLESMEDASGSSIESFEGVEDRSLNNHNLSQVNYEEHDLQETSSHPRKSSSLETDEISKLLEQKNVLETKFQELEKTSAMLSNQLALKSQQLKLTEAAKEQEITALQFQLNSEVLKYERALQEFATNNDGLNDMKQKVNDQEELILALEEALAEIQSERENEKDQQWEQLQDIQLALAAREEECILLSADLEKLEDFKKYCLSDREVMENEITRLRSDSKKLQKKIISLLKDKDILWKRNDRLTFLQKIQIDDRWMNDHEVAQCLGCKSAFSFLLRKHHCRQCGRIFCNSCSNNWLLTASSKKQIRICNECYMQHLEIKNVVRRDSNVQCCDDSEDEVDDVSFKLNRSLDSENRPSITDSILSLPVMQETNLTEKSRFTSVPELYMAIENLEVCNTNSKDSILTSQLEVIESGKQCDLLIKAGEEAELPVLNEKRISLHWSFTPNNETIPISLIYENTACLKPQQTVLHQSSCETEGVIHLTLPGLYKLRFDNRSRLTSMSVHYNLKDTISDEQCVHS